MRRIVRWVDGAGRVSVGVEVDNEGHFRKLSGLEDPMPFLRGEMFSPEGRPVTPADPYSLELGGGLTLITPLDPPEVWCAGVTYERSRDARMEESAVSDVYDLVYEAHRPELFLKDAAGRRTVGPGEPIGIRGDSTWNVPEPEIGLVARRARPRSSATRSATTSPRARSRARTRSTSPRRRCTPEPARSARRVYIPPREPQGFQIIMRISRRGRRRALRGQDPTAHMVRTFDELAAWLGRTTRSRPGTVLLTGTGLVPARLVQPRPRELGRDPRAGGRHAREPGRAGDVTPLKGPAMTETPTDTPARNYVGGEWLDARIRRDVREARPVAPVDRHRRVPVLVGRRRRTAPSRPPRPRSPPGRRFPPRPARRSSQGTADAIEARTERIARDMTAEMGKPLREARMEAARAATILRFSAGEAWRPVGEVYAASVPLQRLYTVRRPVGVVGLITPWNFPIAIPVWKLAPALIHGNTVVLKLGYDAPRTGLHVAECFAEAGLPAGVLNVLTGSGSKVGAAARRRAPTCARSRSRARWRWATASAPPRPPAAAASSSSSAARTRSS